jgi:hypothetical protein
MFKDTEVGYPRLSIRGYLTEWRHLFANLTDRTIVFILWYENGMKR